ILIEILQGVRRAAPSLHVSIKINSSEFTYGGLDVEGCLDICTLMDKAGIDSIEVSGNGTSVGGIKAHVKEGYFVPAASRIAEAVSCPVMVVGGFRSLDSMEAVLNKTKIEMISLSRPLLREPDLPRKMEADALAISKCISCNRCYSSPSHRCIFRGRDMA
ncbi:MAG: NADH:flavin oxidoreductase, partial [Blautia sp.]|nr:NADH:flavin oxidoreductase [Blautia sp.]